jgi:hypothetical protein
MLALASPLAAQHSAGGASRPALTPAAEARQFDFLIGQWELTVYPRISSLAAKIHGAPRLLGTWKGWRAIDGFGVEDEMRIVDGSGNPSSLTHALRVYNANEKKWMITGVDAYRGKTSASTGELKAGQMVVLGQGVDEEGKPFITRTRYYDITAIAFKYQQDRSTDGGKTWDEGRLKIEAKRVAAEAAR